MQDGYPEEEDLEKIKEWDSIHDPKGLIDFIGLIWHWGKPNFNLTDEKNVWLLELHTGGWSGNEEIIAAIMENKALFYYLYWQKSERGGHYYFKVSKNVQVLNTDKTQPPGVKPDIDFKVQ